MADASRCWGLDRPKVEGTGLMRGAGCTPRKSRTTSNFLFFLGLFVLSSCSAQVHQPFVSRHNNSAHSAARLKHGGPRTLGVCLASMWRWRRCL